MTTTVPSQSSPREPPSISIPGGLHISPFPTPPLPHSAILSLLTAPLSSYPTLPPPLLQIPLSDTPSSNLLSTLPLSLPFIHTHETSLLIHCFHGISRSPATLIAYILYVSPPNPTVSPRLRVQQTLQTIKRKFPTAHPSDAFLRQLIVFAERDAHPPIPFVFPGDAEWRSKAGPLEIDELNLTIQQSWPTDNTHKPSEEGLTWDQIVLNDPPESDVWLRCRKCAKTLVPKNGRVGKKGQGHAVIPVWPTRWMGECVAEEVGRLRCPKCRSKVGTFNRWEGGFGITRSAVDFVWGG